MQIKFKMLIIALLCQFVSYAGADGERPRLNVWVHGTTIRAAVPVKLAKFHYSTKLIHSSELVVNRGACPRAEALSNSDPIDFPFDSFYLFRWSGLLNHKERKTVAYELYQALVAKITEIVEQTGQNPIVTIITHSHGGNLALYLAKINESLQGSLKIDRLILLACPVQQDTAKLVDDVIFDKVYAFYSTYDLVQVAALQMQKFFKPAARKFIKFSNGNKVVHVKTSWKKRGLWHNEFKCLSFLVKLPVALKQIDQVILQPNWNYNQDYDLVL